MPKSGTSSLHSALSRLGFCSNHNPDDRRTEEELRHANYRLSILSKYDALMDTPIPAVFAQLDTAWPDSKFILTTRPVDEWIESTRRAGFNQSYAQPKKGSTVDFYNNLLFGSSVFNEERYRWVYETHHRTVSEYFSGVKSDQLLTLDFGRGDGWNELCNFLGKTVLEEPFPRANAIDARIELTQLQKSLVGMLVSCGIDYRWLRKKGRSIRLKLGGK
ncbi:MAG: hypothetical protein KUG75_13260 [Pseudomonadales bacterium]|nr:hypothetical protein [Pseudomonadales bacterium]